MSIANLEVKNQFDLFCDELTVNTLNATTQNVNNLALNTGALLETIPALNISNSNAGSSQNIINIVSNNAPTSRISIQNTNPASIANGLTTFDNAGNFALLVGNNNTDGTGYLFTGAGKDLKFGTNGLERNRIKVDGSFVSIAPLNITYPGYGQIRWTTQTIGAASAVSNIIVPSVAGTYTIMTICQGSTAANESVSFQFTTRCRYDGTSLFIGGVLVTNTSNDGILNACTAVHSINANAFSITVTGQATKTINWSGVSTVYY